MSQRMAEIGPDPGLMAEILGLAVAQVKTGESAEQPGVSLRRDDRVMLRERPYSQIRLGEWKSRSTQVLPATASRSRSLRHIATNSARMVPVGSVPRSGRYHSSINPISTSNASVSNSGIG